MATLPYDVIRKILSVEEIPYSTRVELQKDVGTLTKKLIVSDELVGKLNRVYQSRQRSGKVLCEIRSDDKRTTFRIVKAPGLATLEYTFDFRRKGGSHMSVTRQN